MDIHQLRSWIFELYDPLLNERQYIVFDRARGNLLIDAPPFSERALRLIRGTGRASLLLATNAARARDAHRYREALGLQVAAHEADAAHIEGGADLIVRDREDLRPDATAIRIGGGGAPRAGEGAPVARRAGGATSGDTVMNRVGQGATVVLAKKAGGVLFCGDLDLASDAAHALLSLEFSAVLSAARPPVWNAGKDELMRSLEELPKPRKSFGIFLQAPWDRAFAGRLQNLMAPSPLVPRESTSPREAAMGETTLVVASAERAALEAPKRPAMAAAATLTASEHPQPAGPAGPSGASRGRPRAFEENWSAPASPAPPTTLPNPPADIQPAAAALRPTPLGARFTRLAIEDLVGAPSVDHFWGGIDLSPDGSEVAFAWNRGGTYEIFSAPLSGGRIFQLTDAQERCVSPRWSRDGQSVAFMRDAGGDERFGIWLVDRDGQHARQLVGGDGVMHRELAWSPDGTNIACAANVGNRQFQICVIDARTGERRSLTDGAADDHDPSWSPDGSTIAFWSRRDALRTNADLYFVPMAGGPATKLVTRLADGAVKDGNSIDPRWSPDGRSIAYSTNIHGRWEIAVAALNGTTVVKIDYLGRSIYDDTEPVWWREGRAVAYLHARDAEQSVRSSFVSSHADTPVADPPGVHRSVHVGPDGESLAYLFSGAKRPADVFVKQPGRLEARALTTSLPASIDPATLVEPVHVRYAGEGGVEIPALVYVPYAEALARSGPPPAIVHIHGGPTSQHFRWWDFASQWFANRGYVVLAPNIRGSTGYGRHFEEANRRDWGGKDQGDVVKGVEWLVAQGLADPKRVGAYGGSYGGYMTLLSLARAPKVWAAGVSVVGVVSWKTMHETSRGDLRAYIERELGDPATDTALFADRSPLSHVASITAPLLVLQGANDPRVPKSEADQLVAALRAANKTFDVHEYPDEGHGFRALPNRIDALRRATAWFDQHLAG